VKAVEPLGLKESNTAPVSLETVSNNKP
jgi:hypothetical protein